MAATTCRCFSQAKAARRRLEAEQLSTMGEVNVNLTDPVFGNRAEFDSPFEVRLAFRAGKFFPVELEAKGSGILAGHFGDDCFDND